MTPQEVYKHNDLIDPWEYPAHRGDVMKIMKESGIDLGTALEELNRRSGRTTWIVAQAVAAASEGKKVALQAPSLGIANMMHHMFESMSKGIDTTPRKRPEKLYFIDHTYNYSRTMGLHTIYVN